MIVRKAMMLLLSVMLLVSLMPAAGAYAATGGAETEVTGASDDVTTIMAKMSTRQKIMQCMMVDFRKWKDASGEVVDATSLPTDVAQLLTDYQPGSVILFAQNIKKTEDTLALTKDLQQAVIGGGGQPLLIATDQEGGTVYRLGSGTALPGNMALAATGDPANAQTAGSIIGSELESLGINTCLAPVVDVNNNAANPVIGLRSFSDDPDTVGTYAGRYIAGLNGYDIIGCAKHFPGHGDTNTDSHYGLPVMDKSLAELQACELKPFQTVVDQGIEMIMTAHILYPQIDDTKILSTKTGKEESRPATMSPAILTDLLRDQIGYQGVIVTDAMNMQGVADNFTMEQATLEALKAGADMVCMPVTEVYDKATWIARMDSILDTVAQAVEADPAFAQRLDASVTRILTLKKSKGILDYDASKYTTDRALATVGSAENRAAEREIAAKAVTVIRNENSTLPLKATKDTHVLMLAPYDNEKAQMVMGLNRAKQAGIVPEETKVWVDRYASGSYEITGELARELEWADMVIINSEISSAARMDYSSWISEAPKLYTEYCKANGKKSIILSVDKPYDVQLYPDADAILAVYGCKGSNISGMPQLIYGQTTADTDACGPNIAAGVEVVFGVFGASGKLPVNIPAYDSESKTYTSEILYQRGYGLTYGKVSPQASIKEASIQSLKAGKKRFTVKGKSKASALGGSKYQVAYKAKGSSKWVKKTAAGKTITIKGLKKGKQYTVKIRAMKTSGGSTVYGAWSKTKKVKVK